MLFSIEEVGRSVYMLRFEDGALKTASLDWSATPPTDDASIAAAILNLLRLPELEWDGTFKRRDNASR